MSGERLKRGSLQDQVYRVLVVDDDPHLRSMLRRILEKERFEVHEAGDGQDCLERVDEIAPDIILMDVMMPVLDGLSTCARLRARPGGESVPVVMISVLDDYRTVSRAFEVGATDYITKPLNAQVLTNRLRYMLHAARTEQLISRAKNEWEATFDSVSDLIIVTDREGRIVRCNRATVERIGATFATLLGWPIADVVFGGRVDVAASADRVGQEIELPSLGGTFLVSAYPIHVEGTLEGLVYVIRDVTERKQMEMRMLASQKMADLGTLAAGVAHEINSPLQVITGVSQSLLDRQACGALDAERLQKGLVTIHRSGWRCAEIVRALRTYAHAATTNIVPTSLNDVVDDTLLLIENQLKSWASIRVVTDLAPDLPTLYCDRNQITQLLINLLTNARDAMPRGGTVTIRTRLAEDGQSLRLSVSDTGIGIPDSIRSRLFDPFFTTKPPGEGTGLGLSIVAGIVQAHQGEITVDSSVGNGTTFTVTLPRDALAGAAQPADGVAVEAVVPEASKTQ